MRYCTSQSHGPRRRPGRAHSGMNAATGGIRRQRPAGPPRAGVLAAAAACGGSSSGWTGTGIHQTAYQRELGYAECMRAHGLPGFPDPQSNGTFNSTRANAGDFHGPQFLSANKACAHLQGPGMTPAQQRQLTDQALLFVACMHAHGITNFRYFPAQRGHTGGIGVQGPAAEVNSPQFLSAQQACRKLGPGGS